MTERDSDLAREAAFLARARAVLDESAQGLDDETLDRLHGARRAAVARASRPAPPPALPAWLTGPWVMPAGALASVAVTVLIIGALARAPAPPGVEDVARADLELLAEIDDLEVLRDLDFYLWLSISTESG